ncbi:MAG TPA: hypothetical protein VLF68_03820 [Candidatus Saccharimonadales bacterium]|nr:hypothetical protein [Candidatus Saccharimonadales bacterium]
MVTEEGKSGKIPREHIFVSGFFDTATDPILSDSFLADVREHTQTGESLLEIVADHASWVVEMLPKTTEEAKRRKDRKLVRSIQCAYAGARRLTSVMSYAAMCDLNGSMLTSPDNQDRYTIETTIREELTTDPSGFSLVKRVVSETYDENNPAPLGVPRKPGVMPPLHEREITQLGLEKAAEVFRKLYLRGAIAGLGPMPKLGSS